MFYRMAIAMVAAWALAGCASTGVLSKESAPSASFDVAADFQAAHRRAAEYVRVCHEEAFHPFGVTYAARHILGEKGAPNEILIYKVTEPAKILEIIQSEAVGPNTARVKVIVLGEDEWDDAEIAAARSSIQSATPVCRQAVSG